MKTAHVELRIAELVLEGVEAAESESVVAALRGELERLALGFSEPVDTPTRHPGSLGTRVAHEVWHHVLSSGGLEP